MYCNAGIERVGLGGSHPSAAGAIVLKRGQLPNTLAVEVALMMARGQPRSPVKEGAKQFLLNRWAEAGHVLSSLLALLGY